MPLPPATTSTLRRALPGVPATVRLLAVACLLAAAAAASSFGASSAVTVTLDVASATTLTNGCRSAAATSLGILQPDSPGTTSRTAPCTVAFGSTNDTAALRMSARDATAPGMASADATWRSSLSGSGATDLGLTAYDATRMVSVAKDGLVRRSNDGGVTWTWQGITGGWWSYDAEFVPGQPDRVVVASGNGRLHSTANAMSSLPGAAAWTSHDVALSAALTAAGLSLGRDVLGVAVKDASTWVVGGNGFIATTVDGGTSFTAFALTPGWQVVTDVDWVGANEYVATLSGGSFMRTTTGGATSGAWTTYAPTNNDYQYLSDLAVGDATRIYAVARSGAVFRWDGSTFAPTTLPSRRAYRAYAIAAVPGSPDIVTVAGARGLTWRSIDAGVTWTRQSTVTSASLFAAATPTASLTLLGGTAETIVRSTDGGATFTQRNGATVRPLEAADADPVDGRKVLAVGEGGLVRRTSDGGSSWSAATSISAQNLTDVAFGAPGVAWAVGSAGAIYRTSDGGATWAAQASGITTRLTSVAAASSSVAWAVGVGGTILATRDGGATWTAPSSGTVEDLVDVTAGTATSAVAVGTFGAMRVTVDGTSWSGPTTPPTGTQPYAAVAALDETSYLAGNIYGGAFRSTDGGVTWTSSPNIGSDLASLDATGDGSTVFASTYFDSVGVSTDGGRTFAWSGAGGSWGGIAAVAVDEHTAFIAHDDGRIVDRDEASTAAGRLLDYGAGATFGSGNSTSTFGVCLQSVGGAAGAAAGWSVDGNGACTTSDLDPWKPVSASASSVATTPTGSTGSAAFVWGARPRLDQPPGRYAAAVVFEVIAPAA